MKEVILPENLVLGQMTTKMWLPLAKQGRKTFLMLKNIEEAVQDVSRRLWVQLRTPSHLRKICQRV